MPTAQPNRKIANNSAKKNKPASASNNNLRLINAIFSVEGARIINNYFNKEFKQMSPKTRKQARNIGM